MFLDLPDPNPSKGKKQKTAVSAVSDPDPADLNQCESMRIADPDPKQ
jgi:hypothetical protein